jgi:hypothetical protein
MTMRARCGKQLNMQKAVIIAISILVLLVLAWALLRPGPAPGPEPESAPAPPPEAPADPDGRLPEPGSPSPLGPPDTEAAAVVDLPPLEESDPFVREQLEPMDLPRPWLDQGEYVRRLAVLAENASRGVVPRRQLAFLSPNEPFVVIRTEDERILLDPVSYTRYDGYLDRLEAIAPALLAGLLTMLDPLVEAALAEVGVFAEPGEVFAEAVRQVMAVPLLEGEVELVQPAVMYRFADPGLEALPQLHKQLLRMGPDNVRRLQSYLREVAGAMNLAL